MAINLTGQLTIGDANNIGNNSNYIKLDVRRVPSGPSVAVGPMGGQSVLENIQVKVTVWKSKASMNNGKPPIQAFDNQVVNEIKSLYTINNTALLAAPQSNFASLQGKTLDDKWMYWVNQQVLAQIIADNPTFSGTIIDITL